MCYTVKHREQHQLMDQMNTDLTYAVCFNLAVQNEANEMYPEVNPKPLRCI